MIVRRTVKPGIGQKSGLSRKANGKALQEATFPARHGKNKPLSVSHTGPAQKVPENAPECEKTASQNALISCESAEARQETALEPADTLKPADAALVDTLSLIGIEYVPPMACDRCDNSAVCPLFRAGYECGFAHILERVFLGTETAREKARRELVELQVKRTIMSAIKDMNSGTESEAVDAKIQQAINLIDSLDKKAGIKTPGQGILQMLFQFNGPVEKPIVEDTPINVPFEEIEKIR